MLKESVYGLGGTTWEVVWRVVLPYTKAGVIGGVMLGLGRALGETMAIALIVSPSLIVSAKILTDGQNSQTVAANIALNFPDANDLQRDALIGTGLMLFVISFAVNLIARIIVARTGPGARGKKSKPRSTGEALTQATPSVVAAGIPLLDPLTNPKSEGSPRA